MLKCQSTSCYRASLHHVKGSVYSMLKGQSTSCQRASLHHVTRPVYIMLKGQSTSCQRASLHHVKGPVYITSKGQSTSCQGDCLHHVKGPVYLMLKYQSTSWLSLTRNPEVLSSTLTGSSWTFVRVYLRKTLQSPSLVLAKPWKDINNLSCRHDMTEILLKTASNTIQSISQSINQSINHSTSFQIYIVSKGQTTLC